MMWYFITGIFLGMVLVVILFHKRINDVVKYQSEAQKAYNDAIDNLDKVIEINNVDFELLHETILLHQDACKQLDQARKLFIAMANMEKDDGDWWKEER